MYCQKWNISFVLGFDQAKTTTELCEKDITDVVSNAPTMDILPQWRLLQQDGLHFHNEQLQFISFFASQTFDFDCSTAKPLTLGYTERMGFCVASGGKKECRL